MFTGLVEEVGKVAGWRGEGTILISCLDILADLKIGDSVACNGICLTVVDFPHGGFGANVSAETRSRWVGANFSVGQPINLERALRPTDRLGGHIVQGHVDGRGKIVRMDRQQGFFLVTVSIPPDLEPYVVEKGSIAVDGISLTINQVRNLEIDLMIIPHTFEATSLRVRSAGDCVNIEADVVGKYVARQVQLRERGSKSGLDMAGLHAAGYI